MLNLTVGFRELSLNRAGAQVSHVNEVGRQLLGVLRDSPSVRCNRFIIASVHTFICGAGQMLEVE